MEQALADGFLSADLCFVLPNLHGGNKKKKKKDKVMVVMITRISQPLKKFDVGYQHPTCSNGE